MKKIIWILGLLVIGFGGGMFTCDKMIYSREQYLLEEIGKVIDISNGWQEVAGKRRKNVLALQDMCSDMTELYINKLQPDPN